MYFGKTFVPQHVFHFVKIEVICHATIKVTLVPVHSYSYVNFTVIT
jgi:hypothetical protein